VWQEKSLIEIVESVFSQYSAHASWRWADCVAAHLAQSPFNGSGDHRSYTLHYRESDLAFVSRLLAEEGLVSALTPIAGIAVPGTRAAGSTSQRSSSRGSLGGRPAM